MEKKELSTFNKNREQLKHELIKLSESLKDSLPPMTPDTIDDFITWGYKRFDLFSFQNSTLEYKKKKIKEFFKQLPEEKRQYSLPL